MLTQRYRCIAGGRKPTAAPSPAVVRAATFSGSPDALMIFCLVRLAGARLVPARRYFPRREGGGGGAAPALAGVVGCRATCVGVS
mmetsp:Transcript_96892/g.221902  ORF Transcript_96892/g.221902 Transcript_96892/m.221902 type:complete len:85 (+) Transcript_96892:566-820(+)